MTMHAKNVGRVWMNGWREWKGEGRGVRERGGCEREGRREGRVRGTGGGRVREREGERVREARDRKITS